MPLASPPSILTQSAHIGQRLQEWATARGGLVEVMPTMAKLWERAYSAMSGQPTILVCFEREQIRGPFAEQDYWHRVDRQWVVVVLRGKGFTDIHGEPQANEQEFYNDAENVRDQIRTILSISEEFPLNYKGMESLLVQTRPGAANTFLDGYAMRFSTANDLYEVTEDQV